MHMMIVALAARAKAPSKFAIDDTILASRRFRDFWKDEISSLRLLMQSLDLLGLQRDCGIAPAEADIRMMAFGLREFTNFLNKSECLPEIDKSEAPLDPVSLLQ